MNDLADAARRDANGNCQLRDFFPAWAAYCDCAARCPYEEFRTLMEHGVTLTVAERGYVDYLCDPALIRVALVRAKHLARKTGNDGLAETTLKVPEYQDGGGDDDLPLAEFWLNRENVARVLRERGIRGFVWPVDSPPRHVEPPTDGYVTLDAAIHLVLGLHEDTETPPDGQAIRKSARRLAGENVGPPGPGSIPGHGPDL